MDNSDLPDSPIATTSAVAPAPVELLMDSMGIITGDGTISGVNIAITYNGARLALGTDYTVEYYHYLYNADPEEHNLGERAEAPLAFPRVWVAGGVWGHYSPWDERR